MAGTVISVLLALFEAAANAGDVLRWLRTPKGDPVEQALQETTREFGDQLPDVARQVTDFITCGGVRAILVARSADSPFDTDDLVDDFLGASGLYFDDSEAGRDVAKRVLKFFIEALDQALLRSNDAILHLDRKDAARSETLSRVISDSDAIRAEQLKEINRKLGVLLEGQPADRQIGPVWQAWVDRCRQIERKQGPYAALDLWRGLVEELETQVTSQPSVAFEAVTGLAGCHWRLGNFEEAVALFERASEINPDEPRAQLNRALGLMVGNQYQAALDTVDSVLAASPTNHKALAVKANILYFQDRPGEVVDLLAPLLSAATGEMQTESPECCRMMALALSAQYQYARARLVAEQGLRLLPDDSGLQILLANILLNSARMHDEVLVCTAAQHECVSRARDLLDQAVDTLRSRRLPELPMALTLRAMAKTRTGDHQGSLADSEEASRLNPEDAQAWRNRFAALMALNRSSDALALLGTRLDSTPGEWEFRALCDTLSELRLPGFLDEVDRRRVQIWPDREPSDLPPDARVAYASALLRGDRVEEAVALAKTALDGDPAGSALVVLALAARRTRHDDAAAQHLTDAWNAATSAGNQAQRIEVACLWYEWECWPRAVEAFRLLGITEYSPTGLVRRYMLAMQHSDPDGNEDTVLEVAAAYRTLRGADPVITQCEIWVLENRHDYRAAATLWSSLIETSGETRLHLSLARCLYRSGDRSRAKSIIDQVSERTDWAPQEHVMLGYLCCQLGEPERALRYAFWGWLEGRRQRRIDTGYVGVFFMCSRQGLDLSVQEAVPGAAVIVDFGGGDSQTFLLPLSDDPPGLAANMADGPTAERLQGAKTGEVINWQQRPGKPLQCTVRDVAHRYVWAYRTVLSSHGQLFPDDRSIVQVEVSENFREFFEAIDHDYESGRRALREFETQGLPFGFLMGTLGKSVFELWAAATRTTEVSILFCSGTEQEVTAGLAALCGANALVADPLALLTLGQLGLLETVAKRFRRLVVPQHVVEELEQSRHALGLLEQGAGLAGRTEVGYFYHGVDRELLEADARFLDDILLFCAQRAERLGRPRQYSSFEQGAFTGVASECFVIPILVAEHMPGSVLYSDDLRLREFGRTQYGIQAVGTASLLGLLRGEDVISEEQYLHHLAVLARHHYWLVPLDALLLSRLAAQRLNPDDGDYQTLMDALFDRRRSVEEAVRVAAQVARYLVINISLFSIVERFLDDAVARVTRRAGVAGFRVFCAEVTRQGPIVVRAIDRAARLLRGKAGARPPGRPPRLLS
jgi:tetratricopeptide (TPR) repeat protein